MRKALVLAAILAVATPALADIHGPVVTNFTFPTSFPGNVPIDRFFMSDGSWPVAGKIPAGVVQDFASYLVIPSSYTQQPWPNTNYSGYCDNKNNQATYGSCVNYFSVSLADNASLTQAINYNGIISNTDPLHYLSGASTGKDFGSLEGYECNPNIWKKPGGTTPLGLIECIVLVGGGEVVPNSGAVGIGVHAFSNSDATLKWTAALKTDDAIGVAAIILGSQAVPAANVISQVVSFRGYDAASALATGNIGLGATQAITATAPAGFQVATVGSGDVADFADASASILKPLRVGSLTQILDAGAGAIVHMGTDHDLEVRGAIDLADGVTLESLNDALNALKGLEIIASTIRLQGAIQINGTAGVTCTVNVPAHISVVNGIVTLCN